MKHLDQKRLRGEGFVRVYRGLTRRLPGGEASSTPKCVSRRRTMRGHQAQRANWSETTSSPGPRAVTYFRKVAPPITSPNTATCQGPGVQIPGRRLGISYLKHLADRNCHVLEAGPRAGIAFLSASKPEKYVQSFLLSAPVRSVVFLKQNFLVLGMLGIFHKQRNKQF